MTPNTTPRRLARRAAVALLATALGTSAACSDFLGAENPGAIEVDDLNSIGYVSLLANAPVGAFQDAQDDLTYWNGQFTDELTNRNGLNPFVEEGQIDRRDLYSDMTYIPAFIYSPMQRARFLAEDATTRLTTILGDSASRDLRVARAQAYAGYAYVYLGESFCTTPIDNRSAGGAEPRAPGRPRARPRWPMPRGAAAAAAGAGVAAACAAAARLN